MLLRAAAGLTGGVYGVLQRAALRCAGGGSAADDVAAAYGDVEAGLEQFAVSADVAVKAAVDEGTVSAERYQNYLNILDDITAS